MSLTKIFVSAAFLSFLFILSCSSKLDVTLYHQSDDEIDYSQYHTFEYWGWAGHSDSVLTLANKNLIEQSFGKEFKARDLSLVESGGDLIVNLMIVTHKTKEVDATTYYNGGYGGYGGYGAYGGYGYGSYYGYGPGYGWGGGMSTTTVYNEIEYTEGTLVINIFDAKHKILIYEAIAVKNGSKDLSGDQRLVELITRSMMYNFKVKPVDTKKKNN